MGAVLLGFGACDDFLGLGDEDEPQDQIVFISDRVGSVAEDGRVLNDIFSMNADGSGVHRLTGESARYSFLGVSPDRTRIVYYNSFPGPQHDIWIMNVDGTDARQLTGINPSVMYERQNIDPFWSPDGGKIAFTSNRNSAREWDVYVMNADGTGVIEVSQNPSEDWDTYTDRAYGWSPDGRVVVHSTRDGTERAYLVNADGSGLQPLFPGEDFLYPHWSPDGSKLVAESSRDGNGEIYLMNADGTDAVNLSNRSGFDGFWWWGPDPWSPDGSRIAFMRYTPLDEIFVVRADGAGLVNVSNEDDAHNFFHAWTPDGGRILFSSDRTGDWELYLVTADGSDLVNLTDSPGSDESFSAVWVRRR